MTPTVPWPAWSALRDRGLIVTRGRGGSFVADPEQPVRPAGLASATAPLFPGRQHIDLVNGQADLSLQLDLKDALLAGLETQDLHDIRRDQVNVPLRRALERTWPFEAREFSTAGGGTEAVLLEGRRSFVTGSHQGYLRIAITHLPDDPRLVSELARTIRQAATGELRAYLN